MNDQLSFKNMSPSQSAKPSLYAVISGRRILQNFPYWFSSFLRLLGLFVIATDPALNTAIKRRRAFLLLELSMIALDPTIILALDRNLLKPAH
jgi:hypothetical protein